MDVKIFNTNRPYQADGQWIGYARINDREVMFVDASRMCDGVISWTGKFGEITNDDVLRAYDRGQRGNGYRSIGGESYEQYKVESAARAEITRAIFAAQGAQS